MDIKGVTLTVGSLAVLKPSSQNADDFIDIVVNRVECQKHRAKVGYPCWVIMTDSIHYAVCNKRALRANFTGKISAKSLGF